MFLTCTFAPFWPRSRYMYRNRIPLLRRNSGRYFVPYHLTFTFLPVAKPALEVSSGAAILEFHI